jgi:integrase
MQLIIPIITTGVNWLIMASPRLKSASPLLSGEAAPVSLVDLVLASLRSPHTRRSYRIGIGALYAFKQDRLLSPGLLYEWRDALRASSAPATVNVRLAAAKKLISEAVHSGFLAEVDAMPLLRVRGLPYLGSRVGNWLSPAQAKALLAVPDRKHILGCRNYCILAILLGCALRVSELASLEVAQIQQRDGRWVIADILKKRHMRTVAVPGFVKVATDAWLKRSKITQGPLIRQLSEKATTLTTQGILNVVRASAGKIGLVGIRPHDLRRTCARAMWSKKVPLEQIQIMLGHQSIETTMRYLGSLQNLAHAPNDDLGYS